MKVTEKVIYELTMEELSQGFIMPVGYKMIFVEVDQWDRIKGQNVIIHCEKIKT